jgi:hypothetical protein
MSSFVNYQLLSLLKHFVTVGTLIFLYPLVNSHMIVIDTMKSKGFTTLSTLIRFLSSVFCHMLRHVLL